MSEIQDEEPIPKYTPEQITAIHKRSYENHMNTLEGMLKPIHNKELQDEIMRLIRQSVVLDLGHPNDYVKIVTGLIIIYDYFERRKFDMVKFKYFMEYFPQSLRAKTFSIDPRIGIEDFSEDYFAILVVYIEHFGRPDFEPVYDN